VGSPLPKDLDLQSHRRGVMTVLTRSDAAEIALHLDSLGPLPASEDLRPPESGLVMVRGRIGGDGPPFNFGEATVTRAAVKLETGETGFGYVLGRDLAKARLVALCDALVQNATYRNVIERNVVAPIRTRVDTARQRKQQQVAATKVEFFTLVRGEG
jgi:alpha-D-ribose 1-methylphosphonate 5-triphosphate synthase subunit PhnG